MQEQTSLQEQTCISCKKLVINEKESTCFQCPQCSGYLIVRCGYCRINAIRYICPQCTFSGPN